MIHIVYADASVSPKACAEELGYTFLPCVLANLHRAPRLVPLPVLGASNSNTNRGDAVVSCGCLTRDDVDVVVAPVRRYSCTPCSNRHNLLTHSYYFSTNRLAQRTGWSGGAGVSGPGGAGDRGT